MSLHQIPLTAFRSINVPGSASSKQSIRNFVESKKLKFVRGAGFYELSKPEVIQLNKRLLVQRINDPAVLITGTSVQTVLGIDAKIAKKGKYMVEESVLSEFRIYVQSTSYNRHLIGGTTFLYLNPSDPDPFVEVGTTSSASLKRTIQSASSSSRTAKRGRRSAPATASAESTVATNATTGSSPGRLVETVISFDTTGSMYPCLTQVRTVIRNLLCQLTESIPTIRIGILAHGDYDSRYIIQAANDYKFCDAGKLDELIDFVLEAEKTVSYSIAECYELVLHEVGTKFDWTPGSQKSLIMIGDSPPHEAHNNPKNLDWRVEAECLKQQGIRIYAVQALDYDDCGDFYPELARITSGVHLKLNEFSNIADYLTAVCLREGDFAEGSGSNTRLTEFEDTVRSSGRMVSNLRQLFDQLQGRTPALRETSTPPVVVTNPEFVSDENDGATNRRITRSLALRLNT